MTKSKYTNQELTEAVANSQSVMSVMRKLNIRPAGGSHSHLSRKIKQLQLDTSHFTGQAGNKGKQSSRKKTAIDILIVLPDGSYRPKAEQLRRAMIESGLELKCSTCGLTDWLGRSIVLDIDHIDGNWLNNLLENLRFLCPNCHSQTDTFGYKPT